MTDASVPTPEGPIPAAAAPPAAPSRPRWQTWGAALVAVAVGVLGAAIVADNARADGEERPAASATLRPVPVLGANSLGSGLSAAVSEYAVTAFSDPTRGFVLSAWGAAFSDLFGPGGEGVPTDDPDATLLDDPRLDDNAADPAFADTCADEPDGDGCPDPDDSSGATVDGDAPLGPNAAFAYAFPSPDVTLAAECAFGDVTNNELPIAVVTANPGELEVRIGEDTVSVQSDDAEIAEFEEWRESGESSRPPASFVAHCLAVPLPATTLPVEIAVRAVDEEGQVALASTTLLPSADGQLPPSITPLDGTLIRVDVPLPAGAADAVVRATPLLGISPVPDCAALGPPTPPSGWRIGTSVLAGDPAAPGERPYLDSFPRIRRVTVPLPEGEPSLVCVVGSGGLATTGVVVTPPDARRLSVAVTEVDANEALDADDVIVRGTFAELGWTPCGASLPASVAGVSDPGTAGALCSSAGDTGAIAAAGGVLDLTVQTGGSGTHRVRVALSAVSGGPPADTYRVPIPAADLVGTLCTEGADQPDCIEPEGGAVLGTIVVTASWTEGPVGPAGWTIVAPGASPPGEPPTPPGE